ncbi:MAG: competence protein CoiA family protein [Fusobacteriaceae bacterium]
METCLLRKKKICSFDILEENGVKNTELEMIWRIASQKNLLYCDECGEPVFLKSGNIKLPHFAHNLSYDNRFCSKRNFTSTEEYINNKKNIYTILKKIPEITSLEVDFENKVEFLTIYNKTNIKIYLKKIEDFLKSEIKYEGIVFLYGNEKHLKSVKKDRNLFYLNDKEITVLESSTTLKKINLNIETLKNLYLQYIAFEIDKKKDNIELTLKDKINNFLKLNNLEFEKIFNTKIFTEIKKNVKTIADTFIQNEVILDKLLEVLFIRASNLNEEDYKKCLENRFNKNLETILLGMCIQNSEVSFFENNLENIYKLVEKLLNEEEFELSKNILNSLLNESFTLTNEFKLNCYENLALIYEIENNILKTLENYNKMLEIDSKNIYILWKTAYLKEAKNDLEGALEIYNQLENLGEHVFKEKKQINLKIENELKTKQNSEEEILNKNFFIEQIIGELYFLRSIDLKLEFKIVSKLITVKLKPLTSGDNLNCKIRKNKKNEFDLLEAIFIKDIVTGIIKFIDLETKIIYVQDLEDEIYYQYSFDKAEENIIKTLKLEDNITLSF